MKRKSSKIIFREIKKMKILDINNLLKNQKENEIKKDIEDIKSIIDLSQKYRNRLKENEEKRYFHRFSFIENQYNIKISFREYISLRDYILKDKNRKSYKIIYNDKSHYILDINSQFKIFSFIKIINELLSFEIFDNEYYISEKNKIEKIENKMKEKYLSNKDNINRINLIDNIYIDEYLMKLFRYYIEEYNMKDLFIIKEKIEYYRNI